jgi:RimJ/RimL family protein N-acetyltransferase
VRSDPSTSILEPSVASPKRDTEPSLSTSSTSLPAGENGLAIQPATWDHAPAVINLIRSSASWYEDLVEPEDMDEHLVDEAWARKNFRHRDFHVGLVDGEVVGTISLQSVHHRHLYLGYVYLHVDHVGNSFGADLLDFAREEGERRGFAGLVLIAHPDAEWACRAYRKYGFQVIAESRDEVLDWEDGWLAPYHEEGFHLFRYPL